MLNKSWNGRERNCICQESMQEKRISISRRRWFKGRNSIFTKSLKGIEKWKSRDIYWAVTFKVKLQYLQSRRATASTTTASNTTATHLSSSWLDIGAWSLAITNLPVCEKLFANHHNHQKVASASHLSDKYHKSAFHWQYQIFIHTPKF